MVGQALSAPQTHRFSVRGLEIGYHTWGDPKDPPLLMLHGFMDTGLSFGPVVRAMKGAYYVVAPDMRGHGHSGWVGPGGYYHFYDYFHDVRMLIEHLGLSKLSVVGHSMGGSIACGVSAMLSERIGTLFLLEGAGPPFHEASDAYLRLTTWSSALQSEHLQGDQEARRRARKPMKSAAYAAERLARMNEHLEEAQALELAKANTEPVGEGAQVVWRFDPLHRTPSPKLVLFEEYASMWRAIKAPVLSLFGADSAALWGDLEARHECFQDLRAGYVPRAGHNVHHDRPELVARVLEHWLEAVAQGRTSDPLHEELSPF